MEEPVTGDVQIFLSSKENCVSMRSIGVSCETFLNGVPVSTVFQRIHIGAAV